MSAIYKILHYIPGQGARQANVYGRRVFGFRLARGPGSVQVRPAREAEAVGASDAGRVERKGLVGRGGERQEGVSFQELPHGEDRQPSAVAGVLHRLTGLSLIHI